MFGCVYNTYVRFNECQSVSFTPFVVSSAWLPKGLVESPWNCTILLFPFVDLKIVVCFVQSKSYLYHIFWICSHLLRMGGSLVLWSHRFSCVSIFWHWLLKAFVSFRLNKKTFRMGLETFYILIKKCYVHETIFNYRNFFQYILIP